MVCVVHNHSSLTEEHLDFLESWLKGRRGFFVEAIPLPKGLTLPAVLYGPLEGDDPVLETEVTYVVRYNRPCASRMVDRPPRIGTWIVVIGVGHNDGDIALYDVYGSLNGVIALREPGDSSIDNWEDFLKVREFWSEHALVKALAKGVL
jgi:hypothetical protein